MRCLRLPGVTLMTDTPTKPDPERIQELLEDALKSWPQFDTDEPVNGGDLVEWFSEWRRQVKEALDLS